MPLIHMASIACGGHAGRRTSMSRCVNLAKAHGVVPGAHPSYPDRENFGRQSLHIDSDKLLESLVTQVRQLQDICEAAKHPLAYIKPHGALYNDAVTDSTRREGLFQLAQQYDLPLVFLAQRNPAPIMREASAYGVSLIFEAFADRAYTDSATLVPRNQPHSVHQTLPQVLSQAKQLSHHGGVSSENNNWIPLRAETLCVHSDSVDATRAIASIRATVLGQN